MTLRSFDDVTVGEELPSRVVTLTRGNLVNYAGVSGDPNPIHWSDKVAELAGLRNVVGHGMLSMGIAAGFVTDWLGDPGAVNEYNVRFTSRCSWRPTRRGNRVHRQGQVGGLGQQDSSGRDRGEVRRA